ncbi:MAG: hypothetical protein QF738_07130 [Rhodospirillales bacterium]|jgi:hypothetical protein|nr:hypothetical protein [Rhodospirillales bacterium]
MRIATFNPESLGEGAGLPKLDERIAVLRPQILHVRYDGAQDSNGKGMQP